MQQHWREAVAARGFEHLRREAVVSRESAVQVRAIGDLNRQLLDGARAKSVDVLELPVTPKTGRRFGGGRTNGVKRLNAKPMPGDDRVIGQVLALLVPAHNADLASGDGVGDSQGNLSINPAWSSVLAKRQPNASIVACRAKLVRRRWLGLSWSTRLELRGAILYEVIVSTLSRG